MKYLFSMCCLWAVSATSFAQEIKSVSFSHQDWEIYCSNTGTCRAAGYHHDNDYIQPASLLLTRQAGAKQAVRAEFVLADDAEQSVPAAKLKNIHFYVNGKDFGAVVVEGDDFPILGKLSENQINALLQQAKQNVEIVFKNAHFQWKISDAGLTATLLKMDDFQKRVGTIGALVKKGKADESKVLAAQPKRVVKKVKTTSQPYLTLQPNDQRYASLYRMLMAAPPTPKDLDFCDGIYDSSSETSLAQPIELYALSNKKVLAMTLCWRGAYNVGYGAWVLDESLTGKATYVAEDASGFFEGVLDSAQKGRGIGDCWAVGQWVWNGQAFIHTRDMWTGMCKGLAAGGVWELDLIESVVR